MTHAYAFVLAGTVLSQARVGVCDVLRTAGPPVCNAASPATLNANVPQVLGGPIAAGLLLMDGLANIRGWQWIFIVEGTVTVVVGMLLKAGPGITWLHLSLLLHAPQMRQSQLLGSCVRTRHELAPRSAQVHASTSEHGRRLMRLRAWAGRQAALPASPARAWCLTSRERAWAAQRMRAAGAAAATAAPASASVWRALPPSSVC
jgi:hypothetical protein